jgi:hypothetical protein
MNKDNEISSLSMFASSGINSNSINKNNNNKNSGKISPSSITFSSEELDDINKLNNKLSHYNNNNSNSNSNNNNPLHIRSPAHEFEAMSSGLDDLSTKSCNVVGFLDYDPLVAASVTHKKFSNTKKNLFFR